MDDRDPWDDTEPDDGGDEELEGDEAFQDDPGDDADTAWVHCPYCGEAVELLLDPAGGAVQEYVEDCEVCCRPWRVEVSYHPSGALSVELFTDDE